MGFDSIRNNPKQLSRPMSRQAFRPGQWNGVRIGSGSTTYIQNNFYGTSTSYRGWGEAWTTYDSCPPPCNNDSNKMSILGWIGLGTGLLGGILGLFGVGKKSETSSENGGVETQLQTQSQSRAATTQERSSESTDATTSQSTSQQATSTATEAVTQSRTSTAQAQQVQEPTVDNYNWDDEFETYAIDEEVGGKSPTEEISGEVKVTEKDENGKAPKKFTLTDGNNTYTFEKIEGKDGKVSYKCTGCTGDKNKTYTQGNVYECRLVNGKPVLVQPKEAEGWGMGLDKANS